MMKGNELIKNTIIVGERNYDKALDLVIAKANTKLLIFDPDLTHGGYISVQRFNLIYDFLNNNALSELTIVLQNSEFFTNECPRLFSLLSIYDHKISVYVTNKIAKVAKDCFVLVDDRHYLRRFHIDQARFKYMLNDIETTASLNKRFEEIMQEVSIEISATKLGL